MSSLGEWAKNVNTSTSIYIYPYTDCVFANKKIKKITPLIIFLHGVLIPQDAKNYSQLEGILKPDEKKTYCRADKKVSGRVLTTC